MPAELGLNFQKCSIIFLLLIGVTIYIFGSLLFELEPPLEVNNATYKKNLQKEDMPLVPDDKLHHIEWFMQVSDIHISIFHDLDRGPDLEKFCSTYISIVQPKIVLVTGDLTDAKYADKQGSTQFEEEWKEYDRILRDSKVLDKTVWLDVRGNHDAFNVPSLSRKHNLFRVYSNKGKTDGETYRYVHQSPDGDKTTFIGIDACPSPGPKRPFNFFGLINEENMSKLERWAKEAIENSDRTIWFGHYPTSTIASPQPGIKQLISQGSVYMCGHLHTLGGLVPHMYAKYKPGNLELELGDWKDSRIFRIFAIDHGLFSFADENYGTWPIILITNPKNGQFNMPNYEPTRRMLRSTHIRILVFSPDLVNSVVVVIDGKEVGEATHSEGPLFVLPWKPEEYSQGIHKIEVSVTDNRGRGRTVHQPFSLDNSEIQFSFLGRLILLSDHGANAKFAFIVAITFLVAPLIILRFVQPKMEITTNRKLSRLCVWVAQLWLRRLYLIATTDSVFYPLLFFHLYLCFGPWFIGELIEGNLGVCFIHGLYIDGSFIPGTLTYFYGVIQIIQLHIPLTLYYGRCLDLSICEHKVGKLERFLPLSWLLNIGVFAVLVIFQAYMAFYGFYLAYGGVAFLLCPVRTWSIFAAIYIRKQCFHPKNTTRVRNCMKAYSAKGDR